MSRPLFALLLSALPLAAAPVPKALTQPHPTDGRWETRESVNEYGTTCGWAVTLRWVIAGEGLAVELVEDSGHVIPKPEDGHALAPGGRVGELDLVSRPARDQPAVTRRGRVEVDGDTLRYCHAADPAADRPAAMKGGDGNVLYVFKRVKER